MMEAAKEEADWQEEMLKRACLTVLYDKAES